MPAPLPSMTAPHRARARCRIRPTTAERLAAQQAPSPRGSLKGMRRKAHERLNIPGPGAAARGPEPLLSRGGSERRDETWPRRALGHGRAAAATPSIHVMEESPSDACMWVPHRLLNRERDYGNAWHCRMGASRTARHVLTPTRATPLGKLKNRGEAPAQRTLRVGEERDRRPSTLPCPACRLHGCWRHARSLPAPYYRGSVRRFRLNAQAVEAVAVGRRGVGHAAWRPRSAWAVPI